MSMNTIIDLGKACGRELSQKEAARLREIGNRLDLREDDALWPLLAALEYQRVYYEALPDKIAGASKAIMDGISAAAEKETAAAQARLTDSVVEEARNLASKIQFGKLLPLALAAIICLMGGCALSMWAGYQLGAREVRPLYQILLMPWSPIACVCGIIASIFYFLYAIKKYADDEEYCKLHFPLSIFLILCGFILLCLIIFPEIETIF